MGNTLYVRMSGAGTALQAARARLGGEVIEKGEALWHDLREQRLPFFDGATPLWRLSVPPATPPMGLPGQWLVDWGGRSAGSNPTPPRAISAVRSRRRAAMPHCFAAATGKARCFTRCRPRSMRCTADSSRLSIRGVS